MKIDNIINKYNIKSNKDFDIIEKLINEGLICYKDIENITIEEYNEINENILTNPIIKGIALNVATTVGSQLINGGFEAILKKITKKHETDTEHCEDLDGIARHECIRRANIYFLENKLRLHLKLSKECMKAKDLEKQKKCRIKVNEEIKKIKERLKYYKQIF